jgi:PGF-CTERM protein
MPRGGLLDRVHAMRRSLLAGLLLVATALVPAAAAQAPVTLPAGAIVGVLDLDQSPQLVATGLAQGPCFVDDDANGAYEPGEALLVDLDDATCADGVEGNDIRLVPSGDKPAGSLVRSGDMDFGNPAAPVNDDARYFDADGDGSFDDGDTLYLDIMNAATSRVDVGDLRLSAYGPLLPGSTVRAQDADVNLPLAELPAPRDLSDAFVLAYFDVDGDGAFSRGDTMYFDADGPAVIPAIGYDVPVTADVRLGPLGPYPFGSMVGGLDADTVMPFIVAPSPGTITGNLCFIDDDADGGFDPGEALLFDVDAACVTAEGSDLRLLPSAGQPSGSQVRARDADFGVPLSGPLNDDLRFFDADGNGALNPGDSVYIDILNAAGSVVDVGDLRLAGPAPLAGMAVVQASDGDLNRPLGELGAGVDTADADILTFLDARNDGAFDEGDLAYLNTDAGGFPEVVEVGDVRLSALLGIYPAGSIVGPADLDVTPQLLFAGLAPNPCFVDDDADGGYDPGEAVLVDMDAACATPVEGNDLRLTPSAGLPPGSKVRVQDGDFGAPVAGPLNDDLRYFDADGDGAFGAGDTLVLDLMNAAGSVVDVGDLRLTPAGALAAYTVVQAADADLNRALAELPASQGGARDLADVGAVGYYDVDADGAMTKADVLYLNRDLVTLVEQPVSVGDVRLTPLQGIAFGAAPPPPPPPGPPAPPAELPADPLQQLIETLNAQLNDTRAQSGALQAQTGQLAAQLGNQTQQLGGLNVQLQQLRDENAKLKEELAKPKPTPGFEPLMALAALGAALLALRRR